MSLAQGIDWSKRGPVTSSCYCRCGCVFRSHAKNVKVGDRWWCVTQKPCPQCGSNEDVRRVSYDPESYTITKDDIG